MQRQFWRLWSENYSSQLQPRQKWLSNKSCLFEISDVVNIGNEKTPVCNWQIPKITDLQVLKDLIVRLAIVGTSNGHVSTRNISHLVPLRGAGRNVQYPLIIY
jgi:Family of unknown function (DUF5641)